MPEAEKVKSDFEKAVDEIFNAPENKRTKEDIAARLQSDSNIRVTNPDGTLVFEISDGKIIEGEKK